MVNGLPFLEGSAPTIYTEGSQRDGERLFGGRYPALPAGERTDRGEILYNVQQHPKLQPFAKAYLDRLFRELSPGSQEKGSVDEAEKQYADLLQRTLVNSLLQDRRIGLVNLFWLSHSKNVVEVVSQISAESAELARLRFSVHPLLARFYRNVWREACREVDRVKPGQLRFAIGESVRSLLVESLIEDQLPLVLTRVEEIDFKSLLSNNSRYRIKPEIFSEIYHLLLDEIEQRVSSGEPLFMSKLARHLPSMEPESYSLPAHRVKMLFSPGIRRHLFMDHGQFGGKLRASEKFQAAVKRGTSHLAVLEAFDELAFAIQRFEIISRLRHTIHLLPTSMTEDGLREEYKSSRVYRFTESVEVVGDAVDATVMFLDLRGFTETSEGMVSERDLTQQLYTVFDPFVEIITQFGGTVDKFLGDGMMVTFGAVHSSRKGPLNALRTAIELQDKIRELREEEKTHFTMGVSIHYGRVYLAHFIGSSGRQDTTVIGRNVNIAGRLSSASKRTKTEGEGQEQEIEEDVEAAFDLLETEPQSVVRVTVGTDGMLFNEGIAVSRETVLALEGLLSLTRQGQVEEVYGEFYDTTIKKRIVLRHVGDAKFKGVWGAFPVYSVEYS